MMQEQTLVQCVSAWNIRISLLDMTVMCPRSYLLIIVHNALGTAKALFTFYVSSCFIIQLAVQDVDD